jgi:DnaK suppressor protein
MESSESQRFERILKMRLEQTIRSLDRLENETRSIDSDSPSDPGDRCVMSVSKEALFQQSGEHRAMVRTIEAALDRIQQGTFGVCIACGDEIKPRRLDALPWKQYCLGCQQVLERGTQHVGVRLTVHFDLAVAPARARPPNVGNWQVVKGCELGSQLRAMLMDANDC